MITVKWKTEPTLASLQKLQVTFQPAMVRATREVFRRMMARVISLTPKPPSPGNQKYERTGGLVSAWGPAAEAVGLVVPEPVKSVPRNQGRFVSTITAESISLQAINEVRNSKGVPYAGYVEFGVPGIVPVHAMVRIGIAQTEAANDFFNVVQAEWAGL